MSFHVKAINNLLSSTVWDSHKQDSNLVTPLQSIVFGKNHSFNSNKSESTFVIKFNFLGVQKPKCLTISRLSAASGPPRSGPAINKTVTSYQNCNQLSMAHTIASTHSNQRVRSCFFSTFQDCRNRSVLLCQDHQQLPVLHRLGQSLRRQ